MDRHLMGTPKLVGITFGFFTLSPAELLCQRLGRSRQDSAGD